MNFSVLMSLYEKEKAEYLRKALDSIINQTIKPSEILLVKDGPLTVELEKIINEYKSQFSHLFKVIALEENQGLGNALRIGVENCSFEIIARMDSDDVARNDRFEKQIGVFKKNPDISIVGSFISEFKDEPENIYAVKSVPIRPEDIAKYAKWRNPLNHMTVMFRKTAVLNAGNYQTFLYFEDYYLWARMLKLGMKMANIPECLVNARAGNTMIKRRKGSFYIEKEFKLYLYFLEIGFINIFEFSRNVFLKFCLRIMPYDLMKLIYNMILRRKH
ncbi:MAG: glycosyltransferase [bacterium]